MVNQARPFILFWFALLLLCPAGWAQEVKQHKVNYCIDPNWMPYEAIVNEQHIGISADYVKLIGDLAGIDFNLVATNSWEESLAMTKNGRCDAIALLNYSPERSSYLSFSDIYFTSGNVLVTRETMPFLQDLSQSASSIVGVVSGYRLSEYLANYYPDINVELVESELEGLKALREKKIDILIGSMLSVNSHIQQQSFTDLKIAGWLGPEDQLRVGVNEANKWLLPIINKAIAAISLAQHQEIYQRWVNAKIITKNNYALAWQVGAFSAIIILLLLVRFAYVDKYNKILSLKNQELEALKAQLEQKNQELTYLTVHDPLTKLNNRHFFDHHLELEIKRAIRVQHPLCLMLIDLDLFKQINDQHGHSVGDIVLCQVADILKKTIRDIDVLARWGGEEFVILCPETHLYQCERLAERISSKIATFEFSNHQRLTCSIGIAQYHDGETSNQWFNRADKVLYGAKAGGRNLILLAKTPREESA